MAKSSSKNTPKNTPKWDSHDTNRAQKLVWLYTKENYTQRGLSALFGISRERVRQILIEQMGARAFHQHYEDKRQQKQAIRAAEAEKKRTALHRVKHTKNIARTLHVCSVYESMRSQNPPARPKEIAKALGVSEASMWRSIYERRHNVPMDFVRRTNSLNEAELRTMLEMRESGATIAQIGKQFQIRTWQVITALKKARALNINSHGEP